MNKIDVIFIATNKNGETFRTTSKVQLGRKIATNDKYLSSTRSIFRNIQKGLTNWTTNNGWTIQVIKLGD